MPTVNIYADKAMLLRLDPALDELRTYIAKVLSGHTRQLKPEEVSLRLIKVKSGRPIAPLEMDITAYAYPERVARQDEICRSVVRHLAALMPEAVQAHVWLRLCELGHSWEE